MADIKKFKTDFKDEIPANGKRLYNAVDDKTNAIINKDIRLIRSNANTQEGDIFGAREVNEIGDFLNSVSNENLLINGDFQVWQRGEYLANVLNGVYTSDMWRVQTQQATGTINVMHDVNGLKINGITSGYVNVYQPIEQSFLDKYKGKQVTFSYSKNNIITSKTVVIPNYATSVSFSADSIYVTVFNNDVINWVKLESGKVQTPFVPKMYGDELIRCKRYYIDELTIRATSPIAIGSNIYFSCSAIFPVEMYSKPTVTPYNWVSYPAVQITKPSYSMDNKGVWEIMAQGSGLENAKYIELLASFDAGIY